MKHSFLFLFISISSQCLLAQHDTTLVFLNDQYKICAQEKARYYGKQYPEKDNWKRMVWDKADNKLAYTAYYSDPGCTQLDGMYNGFNKEGKVVTNGLYVNNKKTGIWKNTSPDGNLIDSAFYKDGFIYGAALTRFADGVVSDSLFFTSDGNGTGKGFWRSGVLKDRGNYVAGKKE
jgi:antitoxin component YwqK of YwqJK toxin-antitoxin module